MKVRHITTALGALIVIGVLLIGIFAPLLAPHDPFAQDLLHRVVPPEWMEFSYRDSRLRRAMVPPHQATSVNAGMT